MSSLRSEVVGESNGCVVVDHRMNRVGEFLSVSKPKPRPSCKGWQLGGTENYKFDI